jgi:hypothetical protein
MPKNKKELKTYTFMLTSEDYDENMKPFKLVKVGDHEVFKIDLTTYMGVKKDYTKEVLEALTKYLRKEVTKDDLQRALTLGSIEGY